MDEAKILERSMDFLNSLKENQTITQDEEKEFSQNIILFTAIKKKLGTDIMKEIFNQGIKEKRSRVFLFPLSIALNRKYNIPNRTSVVKFLFENVIDTNKTLLPLANLDYFLIDCENWKFDYFLQIFHILLKHLDMKRKTNAFEILFIAIIRYILCQCEYSSEQQLSIKNAIEAEKILIRSGVQPNLNEFKRYVSNHRIAHCCIEPHSTLRRYFLKQLCELPVEYTILKDFEGMLEKIMKTMIFKASISDDEVELLDWLKTLWISRFVECKKMSKDILKNKRTVWQSIKGLCGLDQRISEDIFYEIMLKFSQDEYKHFKSVTCNMVKEADMMNFYIYVWHLKQNCNAQMFHPDIFNALIRYVSKEDVFNYLLAILP